MKKRQLPNYFLINCANQNRTVVPKTADKIAFYNIDQSKLKELEWGRILIKNPLNIIHWTESEIAYDGCTFEVGVSDLSSSINTHLGRWHEYHPTRSVVNLPPQASAVG